MRITIAYRPLTVTVPAWAERALREAIARKAAGKRLTELQRELIDDLHAHEGWAPGVAGVRLARKRTDR